MTDQDTHLSNASDRQTGYAYAETPADLEHSSLGFLASVNQGPPSSSIPLSYTEPTPRLADALEQLAAAASRTGGLHDLLQAALNVVADLVRADVAVLRNRESERLRAKVTRGLDEEISSGFSLALEEGLLGSEAERLAGDVFVAGDATACWGPLLRGKGVTSLYGLPLSEVGRVVGVIYLGFYEARELSAAETRDLRAFAQICQVVVAERRAHEALVEAVAGRDALMSVVAHDLRNPINVISMSANMMFDNLADASARRPVERIMRAAQRAESLIRDLLEVQSIEAGQFTIERRRIDPARAILLAIDSQFGLAAAASIIIKSDISPDMPAIQGDHERLAELLENLIGNALKFTGRNGSVTVGASRQEDEVLFWVQDTGCGIPAEHVPHLFDRFWQQRKRDRRGLGLGLTIAKAIAEAHGGRIWVESEVDVGTTVFFTVPIVVSVPAPAEPPESVRHESPARPVSILLVDDRPENLLSLKAVLERCDYRLVTADSGHRALSLALREDFVLALVDIAMPGMDGIEFASHLKELKRCRDVPVIFITAFGDDPQEVHRAYAAGGADYIVKPLDPEIVRKKVAVFVELSRRPLQPQADTGA